MIASSTPLRVPGELRGVADHDAEPLAGRSRSVSRVSKTSAASNRAVAQVIDHGILPGQLDGRRRAVDPQGRGRAAVPQGGEREPSRVAVQVEHPLSPAILGDRPAVVPLVEVKPRLLPRLQIDEVGQPVLDDLQRCVGRRADQGLVVDLEPLLLGDSPLGARQDGRRPRSARARAAPAARGVRTERQARELDDEPAVVAIDGQPREPVPLARRRRGRPAPDRRGRARAARAAGGLPRPRAADQNASSSGSLSQR